MGVRESQPQAPFAAPVQLAAVLCDCMCVVSCSGRSTVLARQEVVRDPILIPIISESLGLTDGDGDPTGRLLDDREENMIADCADCTS